MNKREKILAIVLGIGVALLMGRAAVRKYRATLTEYDNVIAKLEKDLRKIDQETKMAVEAARQWREEIGPQTLAMDEKEAATRLREELYALAERAGLKEVSVELGTAAKPWQKNGLKVLTCKVSGEGPLRVILGFLFDLHRQPYDVRCKRLYLAQAERRVHTERRRTGGQGVLKMTADLDTLILPTNSLVPVFETADLSRQPRKVVPRPKGASLREYQALVDLKLFEPYQPPAPKPPPVTARRPKNPPSTAAPPPPPPPDARMVLGRTLSSPRGQLAVLEDPGGRGGEDVYKYVGDAMYGGTLVFVHPRGAVTEKDGRWLFHPVGEPLDHGRVLNEQEDPIVYHELLKLRERAGGISKGPG